MTQADGTVPQREDDWETWSDAELLGRLLRRGVEGVQAKGWVRDRMMPDVKEEIETTLNMEYLDENEKPIKFETPIDRRARR